MATGNQDPDLTDGNVDTSGRVRLRPSHPRVVSPGAMEIRKVWILDGKKPFRKRAVLLVKFTQGLQRNGIR